VIAEKDPVNVIVDWSTFCELPGTQRLVPSRNTKYEEEKMQAICATDDGQLEVRDIAAPGEPPSGHVLVNIEAAAIHHGDKLVLARPFIAGRVAGSKNNVWGASASGTILSLGPDVPAESAGSNVAIYRSLTASPHTVAFWSQQAVVPYTNCLILPNEVAVQDDSGSLVNVITAYAFLFSLLRFRG
jgi:NADPH:quinone reductase-like Zn-dependent oxidoreductase